MALGLADGVFHIGDPSHDFLYMRVSAKGACRWVYPYRTTRVRLFHSALGAPPEAIRLLLLSDGIVEATNEQGKLFGFDSVLELVRTDPWAQKIAEAARRSARKTISA